MARRGTGIISVLIAGDASPFNKSVGEAESTLERFASKVGTGFKTLATVTTAAVAGTAVALGSFARAGIQSAIETEAAQSRLATLLRNTGLATEQQIEALNEQAAALETVGVATASNITVLQGQLATFDLSADAIQKLTPAIVDYVIAEKGAAATADDFQAAANGLAQALQGNFGALSRVGFVLDDTTKEMIANGSEAERAAALVDVLSSTYDGFNRIARETTEGQMVALRNAFEGVRETVGLALLPVFQELVDAAGRVVGRLKELWETHGPAVIEAFTRFRDRAKEVWEELKNRIPEALDTLRERIGPTVTAMMDLAREFRDVISIAQQELQETGALNGVRQRFKDIEEQVGDTLDAFNNFVATVASGDTERRATGFARIVELQYIKPFEKLLELIETALKALEILFSALDRFQQARDAFGRTSVDLTQLPGLPTVPQGGTFSVPQSSRTSNITVNVTSADPNAVVDAIRTYERRNGPIGIAVR